MVGGLVALTVVVVLAAPASDNDVSVPHTVPFSGEAAFRGIVFGQGEVAERLPALWSMSLRERFPEVSDEQIRQAADAVVKRIREADPTFLDRFGRAVQSGDHVLVSEILEETGTVLRLAYAGEAAAEDPYSLDGTIFHVYRQIEFWEYLAVYRYGALFEAAWLAAQNETMLTLLNGSQLSKDMLVHYITEQMALTA
ncbi:MAG TPA: hypothetical protein VF158_14030 [Longimicrobiales bacterium]